MIKLTAEAFTGNEIILTDKNDAAVENQIDYKLSLGDLPTTGKTIPAGFSEYFEFGGLNLGKLTLDASGNITSSTLNEVIGTMKEFTFDGKNNFNLTLGEDFKLNGKKNSWCWQTHLARQSGQWTCQL